MHACMYSSVSGCLSSQLLLRQQLQRARCPGGTTAHPLSRADVPCALAYCLDGDTVQRHPLQLSGRRLGQKVLHAHDGDAPTWHDHGGRRLGGVDDDRPTTRARYVSIFLDKNRRHIGNSQSHRPPKRTQRTPHRRVGTLMCAVSRLPIRGLTVNAWKAGAVCSIPISPPATPVIAPIPQAWLYLLPTTSLSGGDLKLVCKSQSVQNSGPDTTGT
jgi:hypothetical protein